MSRSFASNSDHLDLGSAPITPFTTAYSVSAWIKLATLSPAVDHVVVDLGTATNSNNRFTIQLPSGTPLLFCDVIANERDSGTSRTAFAQNGIWDTINWHVVTAVFTDHSNRSIFIDGANKGSGTVTATTGTPNRLRIGALQTGTQAMIGLIAHVAIWNVALTDAEVALLVPSPPYVVQPASIVGYWTLDTNTSPEPPALGTSSLTVTGTTYSSDNPNFTAIQLLGQSSC